MNTNGTNGHTSVPDREHIVREATYHAAVYGWYDTSEAAQRMNRLAVTFMDLTKVGEVLPPGATHRFFVCINATAYFVTRHADGHYEVQPHDQNDWQRRERELREAVLDYGLWYITGEGAGYHPDPRPEERATARAAIIQELLDESNDEEERDPSNPVRHAIVRDELPDISLAPGDGASSALRVLRQWSVDIGGYPNSCEVGLIGYHLDGSPELIAIDRGPEDYQDEG